MNFFLELSFGYKLAVIYLVGINLITLIVYGSDKLFAASNSWRVRERTLLLLAILGGSVGALVGIYLFRHKTKKTSFLLPLVVIILVQLAIVLYLADFFLKTIDELFTNEKRDGLNAVSF